MATEFRLPDLGEGIHEGEVVEILISPGDTVEDGQTIMVVETDKAATEIPSPVSGTVQDVNAKPGEVVNVGDVLVTFTVDGESKEAKKAEPVPKKIKEELEHALPQAAEKTQVGSVPEDGEPKATKKAESVSEETKKESERTSPQATEKIQEGPVPAAPSVRRLARELGVDLKQVSASGPGGRVMAEDVRAFAQKGKGEPLAPEVDTTVQKIVAPQEISIPPLPDFSQWGAIERTPLRSVRRATAKRMALSWSQIPHVTHSDEADVTDLEAMRQRHKASIEAKGGKLTMTVFALKAAVAALKAHPYFNSTLDMAANEIVLKHYFNIGVAVDTERGLLVPVLRDVDCQSITDLAKQLYELAERTRSGLADIKDVTGGTFTITNVGSMGGTSFTPIINYPQVAILGLGRTRLQPVVRGTAEDYEIVPRLILPLSLAFDHRIVDGAEAARFMNVIIKALEQPDNLVMMA